jgi:hypothetical protein
VGINIRPFQSAVILTALVEYFNDTVPLTKFM